MLKELITHVQDKLSGKVPAGSKRSAQWPTVREAHLKVQPVCQCCMEKDNLQVHHLRPFHIHPELELDPNNLTTLCEHPSRNCHILFGHLRNFKSYNPDCETDVKLWRGKMLNRPKEGESS